MGALEQDIHEDAIAIIGMACRFPGAATPAEFWENIERVRESIQFFTTEELEESGVPSSTLNHPDFVNANGALEGVDLFDAKFFGFSPRDAAIMDPQHRIFLECAWESLEFAGYDPARYDGAIGVYAGSGMTSYMMYHLASNPDLVENVGEFLLRHTGNDKDFLTTRVSYDLDLKGPSVNVQTACSTSLVAMHLASQALLTGECDMALAGGVTIMHDQDFGYVYKDGEILSPDGHCRSFDANSGGTVFGSGAGIVVLKKYEDALQDGDTIYSVILGSAVNNDGSMKVSYLAPSVDGQVEVISEALAVADVDAKTIGMVEAHGTGTPIGDPIEVSALTQAYRAYTDAKGYCVLGSVKTNIGHLDTAAGVASVIKTSLALRNKKLPGTVHFRSPNPKLSLPETPFVVRDTTVDWPDAEHPRRAGVSSLGVGGTNAHLILQEPPHQGQTTHSARKDKLIVLSAKSDAALEQARANLAQFLVGHPETSIDDAAYTLQVGRQPMEHRLAFTCIDVNEAVAKLESGDAVSTGTTSDVKAQKIFMFSGQGSQYVNMAFDLYRNEKVFRKTLDECADLFVQEIGKDLRTILFPSPEKEEKAKAKLNQTSITQPALFAVQYACAKLFQSWGILPDKFIGHSIGEYTAACLSGVFTLADAVKVVAARGRLMQSMEPGRMLSVSLTEQEVQEFLSADVSLATLNAPGMCVLSGPEPSLEAVKNVLDSREIPCRMLYTSHAFHSAMMEPAIQPFEEVVSSVSLGRPDIPFVSNVTGALITDDEATSPAYWAGHIRSAVRFEQGIRSLMADGPCAFIEIGVGTTLQTFVRAISAGDQSHSIVSCVRHPKEAISDSEFAARSLGALWTMGVQADWKMYHSDESRRRIALPTYPFEHKSYWIPRTQPSKETQLSTEKLPSLTDWFSIPSWERSVPKASDKIEGLGSVSLMISRNDAFATSLSNHLLEQSRETNRIVRPLRLVQVEEGDIDRFAIERCERSEPGPNEVEIRVHASALQFKDVLVALGLNPQGQVPLGVECAGIVTKVGAEVTRFAVGDAVVATELDSFRTYVIRDERVVVRKPAHMSFEDAVTIPSAFITAYHALVEEAAMKSGDRVLIHAATGGVGLAAIQLAKMTGAEIYATAGSPEKRAYLQSLDVTKVYNSRTPDFETEILQATDGAGVDIVLNSLTGEMLTGSLNVLARNGRFLELGKKEVFDEHSMPALVAERSVEYIPIDVDEIRATDKDGFVARYDRLIYLFRKGELSALPTTVFHWSNARDAFKLMAETRHVGKVILSLIPRNDEIIRVGVGPTFVQNNDDEFTVDPSSVDQYGSLLDALGSRASNIERIIHCLNVDDEARGLPEELSSARMASSFTSLFALAKALGERGITQPLQIAVVSTGLQRVANESALDPLKALLLGPCSVIPREYPNISCKSIDVEPNKLRSAELVFEQIRQELSVLESEPVVAYRGRDRWIQTLASAPIAEPELPDDWIRPGGVYVITGGFGGIGYSIATRIAAAHPVKLALLSRSVFESSAELSDIQQAKVDALRQLGAEVSVHKANVSDRESVAKALTDIRADHGSITGVFHAAGVVDDALIALKSADSIRAVFGPKVQGTLNLHSSLESDKIDFVVLFSSLGSYLGLPGQIDYTAANHFLDAYAQHQSGRLDRRVLTINWGAWQHVGMAARLNGSEDESVITGSSVDLPLLDRTHQPKENTFDYFRVFDGKSDWVLDEHRNSFGQPIMPGTGYVELVRESIHHCEDNSPFQIDEVFFLSPLEVQKGQPVRLRVRLEKRDRGYDFSVASILESDSSGDWTDHVIGSLKILERDHVSDDLEKLKTRFADKLRDVSGNDRTDQERFLQFGPRWRNTKRIALADGEALGFFELPAEFESDAADFGVHPAMLDMATGFALPLIPGYPFDTDFYVPVSYRALRLFRNMPKRLWSYVTYGSASGTEVVDFSVTLMDESGAVVLSTDAFTMKRIPVESLRSKRDVSSSSSQSELALDLAKGIAPSEGLAALDRIMSSSISPQVIVSSQNIAALQSELDKQYGMREESGPGLADPGDVGDDFAGPRDDLEARLTSIWQNLLGIKRISINDNFFEIGGHSLVAVRMFTKVRKEFGVDLELSSLFEAPTVQSYGNLIRTELGLELAPASTDELAIEKSSGDSIPGEKEISVEIPAGRTLPTGWTPLVPIQKSGHRPPFFCVHGAGGNVLNFWDLAKYLGTEQPFYGLQARGVDGKQPTHETFEEMANDYIAAIKTIQPSGPYYLGGYSAGGVVAFEMARQFADRGETVALLAYIDTFNPDLPPKPAATFSEKSSKHLKSFFKEGPAYGLKLTRTRLRFEKNRLRKLAMNLYLGMGRQLPLNLREIQMIEAYHRAADKYRIEPLDGKITLFTAKDKGLNYAHVPDHMGWEGLASKGVEILKVPGTHDDLVLEPNVRYLVEALRIELERAQSASANL